MPAEEAKSTLAFAMAAIVLWSGLAWIVHGSVAAWKPPKPEPTKTPPRRPAPATAPTVRVGTTGQKGAIAAVPAVRFSSAPRVDGQINEWPKGTRAVGFGPADVSYQPEMTADDADFSGEIRAGWTDQVLFLAVIVRDDRPVDTGSVWASDHLEVFLDTRYQKDAKGPFGQGQFQIGLALSGRAAMGHPDGMRPAGVECEGWRIEGGWALEAAIPWKLLGIKAPRIASLGVDLCVSDSDSLGSQDSVTSLVPGRWSARDRSTLVPLLLEDPK